MDLDQGLLQQLDVALHQVQRELKSLSLDWKSFSRSLYEATVEWVISVQALYDCQASVILVLGKGFLYFLLPSIWCQHPRL